MKAVTTRQLCLSALIVLAVTACGAPSAVREGTRDSLPTTTTSTQDIVLATPATDSGATPSAANGAPPVAAAAGKCELKVTGDVVHDVTATTDGRPTANPGGGLLFSTRHWMTEAQVAEAAAYQADVIATVRATVATGHDPTEAAAMLSPLAMMEGWSPSPVFKLNCGGPEDRTVVVGFGNLAAGPNDIAMAPGVYTIPAGMPIDEAGQPRLALFFPDIVTSFSGPSEPVLWGVAAPGRFEITRFDDKSVAGTFMFDAANEVPSPGTAEPGHDPRQIHVLGSFEFQCVAEGGCGKQ